MKVIENRKAGVQCETVGKYDHFKATLWNAPYINSYHLIELNQTDLFHIFQIIPLENWEIIAPQVWVNWVNYDDSFRLDMPPSHVLSKYDINGIAVIANVAYVNHVTYKRNAVSWLRPWALKTTLKTIGPAVMVTLWPCRGCGRARYNKNTKWIKMYFLTTIQGETERKPWCFHQQYKAQRGTICKHNPALAPLSWWH
jgi:hypothetical protein